MKKLLMGLSILLLGSTLGSVTNASPVQFVFSGTISNEVNSGGVFTVGTPYSLTFTFDDETLDANSTDIHTGLYQGAITSFTFNYDNGSYLGVGYNGDISVFENAGGWDQYSVLLDVSLFPAVNGDPLNNGNNSLILTDTTNTALLDDQLPSTLDILDFSSFRGIAFYWDNFNTSIGGTISDLEIIETVPVPLPSTFILLVTGLAGLLGSRAKQKNVKT